MLNMATYTMNIAHGIAFSSVLAVSCGVFIEIINNTLYMETKERNYVYPRTNCVGSGKCEKCDKHSVDILQVDDEKCEKGYWELCTKCRE